MSVNDDKPRGASNSGISKSNLLSIEPMTSTHKKRRSPALWPGEMGDDPYEEAGCPSVMTDTTPWTSRAYCSRPVCAPSRCRSHRAQAGGSDRSRDRGVALLIAILMGLAIAVNVLSGS